MARDSHHSAQAPEEDGQVQASGLLASVSLVLGRIADGLDEQNNRARRKERLFESLHQVPIGPQIIPISGGNGVLQLNDVFKAKTGYVWSLESLSASHFTAGSVSVFKNGQIQGGVLVGTPEPVPPFPQAGVNTFSSGNVVLQGDDWLTFVATGITLDATAPNGVLIYGTADCMLAELLPDYLL